MSGGTLSGGTFVFSFAAMSGGTFVFSFAAMSGGHQSPREGVAIRAPPGCLPGRP